MYSTIIKHKNMIVNRSTKCPWTRPLTDILDADPVDWEDFSRAHRSEPKNLSALIQHLSFSEVLNHFPPPNVVHELLAAHHDEIVRSPTALIKLTLLSACATSCLEVVELIAKDASYILQLEIDLTGDLPLHRAKSLEAAIILVQAYPQGVGRKNRDGNLPLHVAIIEHRHEDLIMMLVKKGLEQCIGGVLGYGGILVQNKDGETALSLLYSQCRMGPITVPLYGVDVRLWETLKYFMNVYDLQRHNILDSCQLDKDYMDDESRLKTPLIHHLLSLDAPENVIELCLAAGSTNLDDIDDLGRVAFSCIVGNKRYSEQFIFSCLQTYPNVASREDRRRRLPLHYAVESGRQAKDGLIDIINAFPNALSMSDADGMYPCMLAAFSSDCTLDLIYTLLREAPDVLK